jgi:DNA ligase-1
LLFAAIDETTRTNEKVDAMVEYFRSTDPADAAWAVWFLSGGRPKRLIPVRRLAAWAMEEAAVPEWLFSECYDAVGDLAEAMSLLLPDRESTTDLPLHRWITERLLPLATKGEEDQRARVVQCWRELGGTERFIWNKLSRRLSRRVRSSSSSGTPKATGGRGVRAPVERHCAARRVVHVALPVRPLTGCLASVPFFLAYPSGTSRPLSPAERQAEEVGWHARRSPARRQTFIWSRGESWRRNAFRDRRRSGRPDDGAA